MFESSDFRYDGEDGDEDTGSSDSSERSTEDQNVDVWCSGANNRSEFEEGNGEEEGSFKREESQGLSVEKEEGGLSEEVGGGDPGELVEGLEFRCDEGESGSENSRSVFVSPASATRRKWLSRLIEGDEEYGQQHSTEHQREFL